MRRWHKSALLWRLPVGPPSPAEQETVLEAAPAEPVAVQPSVPHRRKTGFFLVLLVIGALSLRCWGITWSLPNQDRLFSYHPDEGVNLVNGVLDRDRAPRPHLDLRFYNYG